MGWTGHKLPQKGWRWWTRGSDDLSGNYIQHDDSEEKIEIPPELLIMLLGQVVLDKQIAKLEDMTAAEVLGLDADQYEEWHNIEYAWKGKHEKGED